MDYVKMKKVQQKLYPKYSYPTLRRNRKGLYSYGGHKLPLVTTILSLTKDTSFLKIMFLKEIAAEKREAWNGRLAMLGIVAALGAYALTGDVIPGIW